MGEVVNRRIHIYIDQQSAEASLKKLQKQADTLTEKIKKGQAAGKDMGKELEKLAKTNSDMKQLSDTVEGKIAPSFNMVAARVRELQRELKKMSEDAPGYAKKFEEFENASRHLDKMKQKFAAVRQEMNSGGGFFGKWGDQIKAVALGTIVGNTVQAGISKITGYFSNLVSGNAALADSLAAVAQTTGLSINEVKKLSSELGKINTRTARSELLKIAEIAGQFNVPREQIASFVEEINKANVVLGSEFSGGAEAITTEMALLRNVFGDIKSQNISEDIAHISNAVIKLAQEGAATGPIVTDFAKRLGQLISTAGLTSGQVLGLGATLEELAVNPERGGTAVVRLFDEMAKNLDAFAKVAGMSKNEFRQLLADDAMGGFVKVLEGFKKNGGDAVELSAILQEMEVSGIGAKEVLVKLSDNTEMLASRANLATEALKQTDAITEQYNKKNDNLAGVLEKIGKVMHSWFVNSALMGAIESIITKLGEMTGALDSAANSFNEFVNMRNEVRELEKSMIPLLDRYDELKAKTSISNEEQKELKDVIIKVGDAIPYAITEFDNYGNAMGIASDKARGFINLQREALKEMNRVKLAEAQDTLNELRTKRDEITGKFGRASRLFTQQQSRGFQHQAKETGEALYNLHQELRQVDARIQGVTASIKIMGGDVLADTDDAADKVLSTITFGAVQAEEQVDKMAESIKKFGTEAKKAGGAASGALTEVKDLATMTGDEIRKELKELMDMGNKTAAQVSRMNSLKEEQKKRRGTGGAHHRSKEETAKDHAEKTFARITQEINDIGAETEALMKDLVDGGKDKHAVQLEKLAQRYQRLQKQLEALPSKYVDTTAALARLNEEQKKELAFLIQKQQKERDGEEFEQSLKNLHAYYQQKHQLANEAFIRGDISERQHKAEIARLDREEAEDRVTIIEDYAPKVQKAAEMMEDAKTKALDKGINDRLRQTENEYNESIRRAEREVVITREGTKANSEARIALLNAQFEKETALMDEHSADYQLKEAQLQENIRRIRVEGWQRTMHMIIDGLRAMQNVVSEYFNLLTTQENEALAVERSNNEKKKDSYKRMMESKRMTHEQYTKKIEQLDEAFRKKENAAKKKQFERNKTVQLAEANMNAATSITAIWAQYGAYPVVAAALTVLSAAATGIKIAAIAKTKYQEYEKGGRAPKAGRGGLPKGPTHAQGGISMYDDAGNKIGEMEGEEAILSRATVRNNPEAVNALLHASMNGGGRRVDLSHLYGNSRRMNYRTGSEIMHNARFYRGVEAQAQGQNMGELAAAVNRLNDNLESGIYASVNLYEFNKKQKELELLKQSGSFKK